MAWYWWLLLYAAFLFIFLWAWGRFMGTVSAHDAETRRILGLPPEDED